MPKVSIIMAHYSEDQQREDIAMKVVESVQQFRPKYAEFIIVTNGYYLSKPHPFIKMCDQWHERENNDCSLGRSFNIGINLAKYELLFTMCNDNLLLPECIQECVRLIEKYPQYIVVPMHQKQKWSSVRPLVDGYLTGMRMDDQACLRSRRHYEEIGEFDEIDIITDGINYVNRRTDAGIDFILTKEELCVSLAEGHRKRCYNKSKEKFKFQGYRHHIPCYDRDALWKYSYGVDYATQT